MPDNHAKHNGRYLRPHVNTTTVAVSQYYFTLNIEQDLKELYSKIKISALLGFNLTSTAGVETHKFILSDMMSSVGLSLTFLLELEQRNNFSLPLMNRFSFLSAEEPEEI